MRLHIENIGKISSAEIELNGLTVICGNNNTGKSTVGKVLFTVFGALCNAEENILRQRQQEISRTIRKYSLPSDEAFMAHNAFASEMVLYLKAHSEKEILHDDIVSLMEKYPQIEHKEEILTQIMDKLRIPRDEILKEYVYRYFNSVLNGQIRNANVDIKTASRVLIDFSSGRNSIQFYQKKCVLKQNVPIVHPAFYIDNPFVLDSLNTPISRNAWAIFESEPKRSLIDAIVLARENQSDDKMQDIFDSVENKDKLKEVDAILRKAYSGSTVVREKQFYYHDGEIDIDFRNLSTGLKSFALIEQLLESGKLKQKDVLILDEPEIHLHPEWQLIYAEMIVALQKTFDLTVLITTHSPYFLEALEVYSKKHKISQNVKYYFAENNENTISMRDVSANTEDIYKSMAKPFQTLENEDWENV